MKPGHVFLDTVGVLAVLNRSDQWYGDAELAFRRLRETGARPTTTTYVLAECANAAARLPIRTVVCELREELESTGTVVTPESIDRQTAWDAYRRGEAGGAGLVDHLSFAVMRRLGLSVAFTNDRHFRAAGFEILF
jgi:predicted nucleic acid-binding protein